MSITNALSAGATFFAFDSVVSSSGASSAMQNAGIAAVSNYVGGWVTPMLDVNASGGTAELVSCAINGGIYMAISQLTETAPTSDMLSTFMYGTLLMAASDAAVLPIIQSTGY
jgi:pheromone shutdown protein TraB